MIKHYSPSLDEYPCVSVDQAHRLKEKGYPQNLSVLSWSQDEDGIPIAVSREDNLVSAPSCGELLRYYLELKDSPITIICSDCNYIASNGKYLRTSKSIDDAVAEVILATLGDTLYTGV